MSELGDIGRKLVRCLVHDAPKIQIKAANEAQGLFLARAFSGQAKDANEKAVKYSRSRKTPKVGAYSRSHAGRRKKEGRQTSRVDFQMTDRLVNNLGVKKFGDAFGFGFTTAARSDGGGSNGQVAEHLETMYGKTIFAMSEKEMVKIERSAMKEIDKIIDSCIPKTIVIDND